MQATQRNDVEQINTDFEAAMADFAVFCDDHVWIEDKERHCAIKLILWPEQRKILSALTLEALLILLKTRQIGLTWLAAALVLWLGIKNLLHLTVIISASEDHAKEFLARVYFILDRLPNWMVPTVSARTMQQLDFRTDNLISSIKSMPTIEMGAESKTPNLLIIDEAHTIRNVGSIYNASYPGIEQAKGRVIVIANSVKGGAGWGWVRDTYTASMKSLNNFTRIFLPWTAHPGRPQNFRQLMVDAGMDKADVIEHYPETEAEALAAATGSYFADTLARHNKTCKGVIGNIGRDIKSKEIEFTEANKGIVELWRYPYYLLDKYDGRPWLRRYAIGSDISEGLGESSSVAYVLDRLKDEFVCRIRSNRIDAYEWADVLNFLSQYYDRATVCVEVTGAGQTTVKRLIDLKTPQYVRVIPDTVGNGLTKQFGWPETSSNKHELCGDLKAWFRNTQGTVYDALLLDECSMFIRMESGKLDHEEGKRSDCVIAAGLALQAGMFLGEPPEKVPAPLTGWRKRLQDDGGKQVWAA
jgi:hypothetical protein